MKKEASVLFKSGFNCAQSTLAPFIEGKEINLDTALLLGSAFLGGLGKSGHVCGAVNGSLMAIGLHLGYSKADNADGKKKIVGLTKQFIKEFETLHGSIYCKDILGYDMSIAEEQKTIEEKGLTQELCPKIVESSANLVSQILAEN